MTNNNEYKTCDKCCYDILDDEGDVMDHECISDNEMIAEFMGVDYVDIDTYLENNKELQYHTSWDWLMPVAEKIYKERGLDDEIVLMIRDSVAELNIESMYKTIVEFINEHNKYICGSCGDHVNEVVFNEDADVDECTNCTEYYER